MSSWENGEKPLLPRNCNGNETTKATVPIGEGWEGMEVGCRETEPFRITSMLSREKENHEK